jgi:hypothetical protein
MGAEQDDSGRIQGNQPSFDLIDKLKLLRTHVRLSCAAGNLLPESPKSALLSSKPLGTSWLLAASQG